MKAAVYDRYGPPDVVEIRDLPKPTPGPGEILIRVRAATVAAGDWRLRRPSPSEQEASSVVAQNMRQPHMPRMSSLPPGRGSASTHLDTALVMV